MGWVPGARPLGERPRQGAPSARGYCLGMVNGNVPGTVVGALDRAEWARLHRAMNEGPGRRMVQDRLLGLNLRRDDMAQAARYRSIMYALEDGRTDASLLAASRETATGVRAGDPLGLDRANG